MDEDDAIRIFEGFPDGYVRVRYLGRTYGVTSQTFAMGNSRKLLARELGGTDMISCNYYRTERGARLKPCEMPVEKVREFLLGLVLESTN